MKEDYITLKFSLGSPIYFQLGDYIDNELGIFELTDLYKPTYNKTTGAYDYELRLDAYYWKWKNKKFFYTPETTGREAGWNLTAPLKTHLEVFITNLKALGYKFRNQDFIWEIDDTVANTSKLVSYDNVNLIDALTQMAETWECEWWVDNHKIRFGRCEFSSPVDFKAGNLMDTENVNVNYMQRNDSQTAYATRVYAFGSTRNIPSSYRKNLIFDVKKVNRREVSDTERTLDIKYFPISSYIPAPEIKTNLSGDKSPDFTQRPAIHSIYIPFADRLNAGNYKITPNDISVCAYADSATSSSLRKLTSTLSLAYSINGKDKSVLIQSVEGKFVDPQKLLADFKESSFILEENAVDCVLVLKSVAENFSTGSNNYFVSSCISTIQSEAKAANVSITFLAGINKGKTFKAVYNPDFLTGENSNVVRLPDGVVASLGDRYTINNIIKGKVPDSYFSKDDKELTLNGVVQKRLMFPEGIPYVDAYRYSPTGERIDIGDERYDNPDSVEMPKEEAVEEIVIFEDEYPKYNGSVTSISYEEKDEIDEETKNSTGNKYRIYTFKDTEIKNFNQKDFVIAELRIAFQTGYLAGLDFALNVKESDGTGTTFEIARNDDYGRYLPDDVLFPQTVHMENNVEVPADTYILHGFDTAFISEQMLPDSEQSLLEKAQDYVKKSMIDPSTYNCEMDNTYIYNNGNIRVFEVGDRVNLVNKAYFPDGRQSRIIGFEWPLDIPYDHPIYTIGETAAYSRIGEIESKIDSLTYKGQTYSGPSVGDGRTSVYVIGVNDKTPPSDTNVFSSKKSLDTFLRKDQPNAAEKVITFLEGLISTGLSQANNGLVVRKTEVVEEPMLLSLLSEEFDDGIVEENNDVLIEEMRTATTGAATLGELDNVADAADGLSETDDILVRLAGSQEWAIHTTLFSNVSQLMSKVFPFTMTLSGGGTYEKGSSQIINLSWTYDRDIESQSINNESLSIGIRAKQYENVTSDTSYTLKAIQGGQTYTKSVSAQFKVRKYYGVSSHESLTNDQILALSSTWAQRSQGSTVFDCTAGKYPYYIIPTSMVSGIQFWIGGLRNTDLVEEVRDVTNSYGYTESYTLFRLNSIQTGVLNIEVK